MSTESRRNNPKNKWILKGERLVLHTPIFDILVQNRRSSEAPRSHDFYVLKCRDWCNIIPVTEDGKVVFVKQYRVGTGTFTLEIPGGVLDLADPTPRHSAIRELLEETGYAPAPGARTLSLGYVESNPAIQNNHTHCFAVGPVRPHKKQNLDPNEMIEVKVVPIEKIPGLIRKGVIRHALMLNTFLLLSLRSAGVQKGLFDELCSLRGSQRPRKAKTKS